MMEHIPAAKALKARCMTCFRRCELAEGERGPCLARRNKNGRVVADNYGAITSIALDPIEKKPLARFHPGSRILSVGSFGCNLFCPFCQNHEIAHPGKELEYRYMSPEEITDLALELKEKGNIGVAFTYNEPLVGWEFVRDTARLVKEAGMQNVLVTNGTAGESVLRALLPYIDAMNVDLKGVTEAYYRDYLKGDLQIVKRFIELAARHCHLELTCLLVTGKNDSEEELETLCGFVTGLNGGKGAEIPLHLSRYFPRYRESLPATDPEKVYHLVELARKYLKFVYPGNC